MPALRLRCLLPALPTSCILCAEVAFRQAGKQLGECPIQAAL